MSLLDTTLILATLLCALTAGFVFAFATVVMPGIASLDDRNFIRAFQVIDGIIQNGQPIFGVVWIGSALVLVAAAILGAMQLAGLDRLLLIAAALIYIGGVQLPTFGINVPLNNKLQSLDVVTMDEAALKTARKDFEGLWLKWNTIRTYVATAVSITLMLLLLWR